jgi:4-amino-4-deoxy-L-arabinose transferase-like glycosyltransferase
MQTAAPRGILAPSPPSALQALRDWTLDHGDVLMLTAIVAAGAAARLLTLGVQSFDSGETVTASRIIHASYSATFTDYSTIERSGPVYYTLAWGWAHFFGKGEIGLRSLSATFGSATIVVAWLAARELFSKRAALIAAALVAAAPDLFWYSQEARSYPVFIFLTATSLYFFVRALRRPSRGAYAGWAIASALALATHYFSAFSVAPEALWLIVAGRRRAGPPLAATGAVGLAGLALLPLAIHQEGVSRPNGFTSIPVLERLISGLAKFVAGEGQSTSGKWSAMTPLSRGFGLVGLACFAFAIAGVFALGNRLERRGALAVGGIALVSLTVPVGLALGGLDYIEPRNLLGSLVPLLVLAAAGVDVWARQVARPSLPLRVALPLAVAAPLAAFAFVTASTPALQRDNWRGIGEAVADSGRVGVVLTDPATAGKPLNYYLHKALPRLQHTTYPCGVRTTRIVTISRRPPQVGTGSFHLVADKWLPQGWTVSTYVSARPRLVNATTANELGLLPESTDEARVDYPHPILRAPLRHRFAAGGCGSTRSEIHSEIA